MSDDESDLHPNIDKASWFRMKHRSRLEREEKEDVQVKGWEKDNEQYNTRILLIQAKLRRQERSAAAASADDGDDDCEDKDALAAELSELTGKVSQNNKLIADIKHRRAWSSDDICKVKEERTIVSGKEAVSLKATDFEPTGVTEEIWREKEERKQQKAAAGAGATTASKPAAASAASATVAATPAPAAAATAPAPRAAGPLISPEKHAVISYNDYVLRHEATLETYSEIAALDDTRDFLFKHCDVLLHEHSLSYMLLSCLEDEMNGKHRRMKLVARQSQLLTHINELGVSMRKDPREMVLPLFHRLTTGQEAAQHMGSFLSAVEDFVKKIKARAVEKRRELDEERLAEQRAAVGPGGLNPYEVLEVLPGPMRAAFEQQDVPALHKAVAEMAPEDARRFMKMAVDSGLWNASDPHEFDDDEEEEGEGEGAGAAAAEDRDSDGPEGEAVAEESR